MHRRQASRFAVNIGPVPVASAMDTLMDAAAAYGGTLTWQRRENSNATLPTPGGLHELTLTIPEPLRRRVYSATVIGETREQAAAAMLEHAFRSPGP